MNENELMDEARRMFLANAGRKDVILFFRNQGVDATKAETMATEAYKSIRAIRQAMIEEAQAGGGNNSYAAAGESSSEGKGGAIVSLALGGIICFAGIAATMSSDTIWYGAILVGGMMVFKGIIGLAS